MLLTELAGLLSSCSEMNPPLALPLPTAVPLPDASHENSAPSRVMCASPPRWILTLSSLSGVFAGLAGAALAPPAFIIKPSGSELGRFILSATV